MHLQQMSLGNAFQSVALRRLGLRAIALSSIVLLAAGCRSTNSGFQRAEDSAQVARKVAQNVETTQSGVEQAVTGLSALANPPVENPRDRLDAFQSGLRRAEEAWQSVNEQVRDLRRQTDRYFADWEEDIAELGNEDMRSTARNRRSDLMRTVSNLQSQYEDTRLAFSPYLERMRNVNQMLRNDFTSEGIRAAQDIIHQINQEARRQQNALENLLFEANEVAEVLTVAS